MPLAASPVESLVVLKSLIDAQGLRAGVAWLNARVPHRFTGIYKFEGKAIRHLYVHDKLDENLPGVLYGDFSDSFCRFVTAERSFSTVDSALDDRLGQHKYRGVVNAYFGTALSPSPGRIVGTLCHFDFDSMALGEREKEFMELATPLLLHRISQTEAWWSSGPTSPLAGHQGDLHRPFSRH